MNEYKSISAGQLYQNVWKNPLTDIPKDTEREQNYSKIFNPQRSYDTVYRQPSMNHKHILPKNPLADIPKDTEREKIYSKIVNPQRSYDTVYRESSINHQHLFGPVLLTYVAIILNNIILVFFLCYFIVIFFIL